MSTAQTTELHYLPLAELAGLLHDRIVSPERAFA